ncbi:MAG: NAD-dependent succinate-semialdehyde dehydrogenase [Bacteroidota bacterium]
MINLVNPYTHQSFAEYEYHTSAEIDQTIENAHRVFLNWRFTSFQERKEKMLLLADLLEQRKNEYAKDITNEIGKPIQQSVAEIEKCAWVCRYYAATAEKHLQPIEISTDAANSYVRYDPIGVVLAIMPWNYPFWQVFRFIAPALMAGNVGVLKHASNVLKSGENIAAVVADAGFPENSFQHIVADKSQIEKVIQHPLVKAVTLTGSTAAGKSVASQAGNQIKKTVLELGGSNALVVFPDADLPQTVKTCVQARFQNTGQSCIAGKRLMVHESIYNEFIDLLTKEVEQLTAGNPLEKSTFIGVMAREDLAEELENQLQKSVELGATIRLGGKRNKTYFEPTLVENVTPEMPVFREETFGPLLAICKFSITEQAVEMVNSSSFGLGVSLFTEDFSKVNELIPLLEDGAVFINELVKSDPRLPFGGTKLSGYGRELSALGIREFMNAKTIYFK